MMQQTATAVIRTDFGSVRHTPTEPVVAGTCGTWTMEVRLGQSGMNIGGCLALAWRWASDWGRPQWQDATGENYTTVHCSGPGKLECSLDRVDSWHPWDHVLRIKLIQGRLCSGDNIIVRYGDRQGGSPGARVQTFIEEQSSVSIRLDPFGTGDWRELARPAIKVVGGPVARLVIVAPSRVSVGEMFRVLVRADDIWGNPAADFAGEVRLCADDSDKSGPLRFCGGIAEASYWFNRPGTHLLKVADFAQSMSCESNPIECSERSPALRIYWGDIHAQSSIGCGNRAIADYFAHARDVAGLNFASHQANDFLVSNPEWLETQEVTARFNQPGRFVTLLGVEWSGETRVGGDRNIYFPGDASAIRRSSHRHLADKSDLDSDLPTAAALHQHYHNSDVLLVPHVGGRTADLGVHDVKLERLIEIHSTHATSEWFFAEALERGLRVGVTAGSDGVDGRPGTSHPGAMAVRNLRGGLVAVSMPSLTRDDLWHALKARRCYATTGQRILLDFEVNGHPMGGEFSTDGPPCLRVAVHGTAPLESVELFRDAARIFAAPLLDAVPASPRLIRVAWRGAAKPGNWRQARLLWDGELNLFGTKIRTATPYAFDSPAEGLRSITAQAVTWCSTTAGDWDGVILELDGTSAVSLRFRAPPTQFELPLSALAKGAQLFPAQGHRSCVEVRRMPAEPLPLSWNGIFEDRETTSGNHAYWARVKQADGGQAWSSPVYVTVREHT